MKNGCKRDICVNEFCKNNPNFRHLGMSDEELLKHALKLWKEF